MTADANETKLSVVIPTLHEEASIEPAIQSVRAAGIDEIIVVDGGSSDRTVAIAESLGVNVLLSEPGRGSQMNLGAAAATGNFVIFLHADCRLPENTLTIVRETFRTANVVAAGFRQTIRESANRYRMLEFGNRLRVQLFGWVYGDQALVVRKSSFESVGRFRNIPLMEDLELSKRLKTIGKIVLLDALLEVDARRWKQTGVIYQTLRNWIFVVLFHLGASPERLALWYRQVR